MSKIHAEFAALILEIFLFFTKFFESSYCLELNIIHLSDFHTSYREVDVTGIKFCTKEDDEKENCFGGIARAKAKVDELQRNYRNTLLINAGEYFAGNVFHTVFAHTIHTYFMNKFKYTAIGIGTKEFDLGMEPVIKFLEEVNFPLICSNLNDSKVEGIQGKYNKSLIIEVENVKIGFVGYINIITKLIGSPGELDILDEETNVRKEAEYLSKEKGVKIIIAIGHSFLSTHYKIAKIPEIDIVVMGEINHIFLYSGIAPSSENIYGSYPIVVKRADGTQSIIVTASAYGKYLGFIRTQFDENGSLISWRGNPILLDSGQKKDLTIEKEVEEWRIKLEESLSKIMGKSRVYLDGRKISCRCGECNVGNIITDSMVYYARYSNDSRLSNTTIGLIQSGGIRDSFDEIKSNWIMTLESVYKILPFKNGIDVIEIKGEYIWEALAYSVEFIVEGANFNLIDGRLLQVSGLKVSYDICKGKGARVLEVLYLCSEECRIPEYKPLNNESFYKVILPTYLAKGGDGYRMFKENTFIRHDANMQDSDVLIKYIKETGYIITGIEGRLKFEGYDSTKQLVSCQKNLAVKINIKLNFELILLLILWLLLLNIQN